MLLRGQLAQVSEILQIFWLGKTFHICSSTLKWRSERVPKIESRMGKQIIKKITGKTTVKINKHQIQANKLLLSPDVSSKVQS